MTHQDNYLSAHQIWMEKEILNQNLLQELRKTNYFKLLNPNSYKKYTSNIMIHLKIYIIIKDIL
jgi:hypothetical protein